MLKICGILESSASGEFEEQMCRTLHEILEIASFLVAVTMNFPFVIGQDAGGVLESALNWSFNVYLDLLFAVFRQDFRVSDFGAIWKRHVRINHESNIARIFCKNNEIPSHIFQ